jgi:hypothetical protein
MFPKTPSRQRCAARCCNRIEFTASPLAIAAWLSWLAATLLVLLLSVDMPWGWRLLVAAGVVSAYRPLQRFVLLRGPRAVRALEWNGEQLFVWLGWPGPPGRRLPAAPRVLRRYGTHLWMLSFTTAEGGCGLLVDASRQDPRSLRRLIRHLDRASGQAAGPPAGERPGEKLLASRPKV